MGLRSGGRKEVRKKTKSAWDDDPRSNFQVKLVCLKIPSEVKVFWTKRNRGASSPVWGAPPSQSKIVKGHHSYPSATDAGISLPVTAWNSRFHFFKNVNTSRKVQGFRAFTSHHKLAVAFLNQLLRKLDIGCRAQRARGVGRRGRFTVLRCGQLPEALSI